MNSDIAIARQRRRTPRAAVVAGILFAGIAFLWFMGVVRSHLGDLEDQLFSSALFRSGLLSAPAGAVDSLHFSSVGPGHQYFYSAGQPAE